MAKTSSELREWSLPYCQNLCHSSYLSVSCEDGERSGALSGRECPLSTLMRIWVTPFLVLFVVFFGAAELYPWLSSLVGSPPGVLVAGILLAIASNLDKLPKQLKPGSAQGLPGSTQPASTPIPAAPPQTQVMPPKAWSPSSTAPAPPSTPSRSISFTIKKRDS
ncbi:MULTISPECIES: hypothetical protein [unclassified Leptolyngbya]|uniref:hypothetical protein n=1 Tax=unclassified Leptolyngbya TaxID=2650499 RepID=UPI001681DAD8|nr:MULTISPECIES: hypothetical protein [unclassified Leptolyngbya]MBD1910201.1 hypothetical protein [Leptolyngbya sp. FACHB-8]MBD2153834.1 hypothetical protein [Leptolyngbya sp. FACHB-16]